MSREIKFRVWDAKAKCWLHDCWIYQSGFLDHDTVLAHNLKQCVIQQYTGQRDGSGKRIYEGDILRLHNGKQYTVEFIEENNETEMSGYFFSSFGAEIIGNIFENKELLKQ